MGSRSKYFGAPDPDYIQFLLDPQSEYEYYFEVGNKPLGLVEPIGVVWKMLCAHSPIFRAWNRCSLRSEKKDRIPDISPATFKNVLRFVYGHDPTPGLVFNDLNSLFYAAERFQIQSLMNTLATTLIELVDSKNVCLLLTNPACATQKHLNNEITRILQTETDKVFTSPHFLGCCPDTFVKILEQSTLSVSEVEVWRAAVNWAKHKGNPDGEDPQQLRKHLEKPLNYIRLCTLTSEELCFNVLPDQILNPQEIGQVCSTIQTKTAPLSLTGICKTVENRTVFTATERTLDDDPCFYKNLPFEPSEEQRTMLGIFSLQSTRRLEFSLKTHQSSIEITKLECCIDFDDKSDITVRIREAGKPGLVAEVTYEDRDGMNRFEVPISTKDNPVVLRPEAQYYVQIFSDNQIRLCLLPTPEETLDQFTLRFPRWGDRYGSPAGSIFFKTSTSRDDLG